MLCTKLKTPILLAAVAVCSITAAEQQPPQTGTLWNVSHVVIKPDHAVTYRDYLKKLSDGYKKAGVQSFHVYVGMSGNPLEYMVVRSVANYAALDEGPILSKAFNETERAQLNMQRDQCTDRVRIAYERGVAAIGTGSPRAYRLQLTFRARQGMAETYANAIKTELVPALSKVDGLRYRIRRVEWGGSRNEFMTTTDVDKLAALDQPSPVVQALGPDGATAWAKRIGELGNGVEALIYRHLADLSFTITAAK